MLVLETERPLLDESSPPRLVIEMPYMGGMPAGREVFHTCRWVGRFEQLWAVPVTLLERREIKMHLCGRNNAKDGNIRQALIDKLGPQGTKKAPGSTFGLSGDKWAALAVAVTYAETRAAQEPVSP